MRPGHEYSSCDQIMRPDHTAFRRPLFYAPNATFEPVCWYGAVVCGVGLGGNATEGLRGQPQGAHQGPRHCRRAIVPQGPAGGTDSRYMCIIRHRQLNAP